MANRRITRQNNSEENSENVPDVAVVEECVRYIYSREAGKIPIKRIDILKHLFTVAQAPANQINSIISAANKILKQVYNYKLVQVDAKSGVQYIVVSSKDYPDSIRSTALDVTHRRILIAALTHIYMSGGPVREEEMFRFLQEAGLLEESDHATRKIFTTVFTKQMYLTYTKVDEGELAKHVFEWGQRAMEELPKMFLLQKMADAFSESPEYWYEQHKEAENETCQL